MCCLRNHAGRRSCCAGWLKPVACSDARQAIDDLLLDTHGTAVTGRAVHSNNVFGACTAVQGQAGLAPTPTSETYDCTVRGKAPTLLFPLQRSRGVVCAPPAGGSNVTTTVA